RAPRQAASANRESSCTSPVLSLDGAENPVDEAGSIDTAQLLGRLHRLVDRYLHRHILPASHLVHRHAEYVALERRDAVERPAAGVPRDGLVERTAVGLDALDQLA